MDANEKERFLRTIREDDDFRAAVRKEVLTQDLLTLPKALAELLGGFRDEMRSGFGGVDTKLGDLGTKVGEVDTKLGDLGKEMRSEFGKLGERLGAMAEDGADAVLAAVFADKGYQVFGEPQLVALGNNEIDVALSFDDGTGRKTAVVEVKARLRSGHVRAFVHTIATDSWQKAMATAGFKGPWVPYVYGSRVYADVFQTARDLGVGVLAPAGERLAPGRAAA